MTNPSEFSSLGLSPKALSSIAKAGYELPTPVQARAIPPALAGRDVVGCAATGTGKTAAFVLPIVERLAGKAGSRALVLAPTRELALQIAEHVELFGQSRGVRGAVIIGGVGMEPQAKALRAGHEVIVATPGRLIDHLDRGSARLSGIEVLVLDEADRMLDMGFKPQLERILAKLPKARQTLLFSATMAGEVAEFAGRHLSDPVRVEVARSGTVAERAEQRVFHIAEYEKPALLLALLGEDQLSTLVFTRTKHRADRVCKALEKAGHEVARIHGDRSQGQRRFALEGFKTGEFRVLVATDIAARGIDVEEIGHVVNFDLPHVPEDYVHRVGRTARASASGKASSFCSPEERPLLKDIERFIRHPVAEAPVPRDSPIFQAEAAKRAEHQRLNNLKRQATPPRSHAKPKQPAARPAGRYGAKPSSQKAGATGGSRSFRPGGRRGRR